MKAPVRQVPLPLPVVAASGAEDFLVTRTNREAVIWLDAWPDWPGQALVLHGPAVSGKSHLVAIWIARTGATLLNGRTLSVSDALQASGHVALDDADSCPEPNALFHLLNHVRAKGGSLLLTGAKPPAAWEGRLPDLSSRLKALPSASLEPPDDDLLAGLAAKLFADRQITVSDEIIRLMLTRLERSCAAVAGAVERLDQAALAARRPITLALARNVLNSQANTEPT